MTVSGDVPDRLPDPEPAVWDTLTPARLRAGLSLFELHVRYIALGGFVTLAALRAYCSTGVAIASCEHDVVVLALNERFLELDESERLPYTR